MTSDAPVSTPSSSIADVLSIDAVLPRSQDLRPIRPEHVRMLAANIATVGLISPPAVDAAGRLLAGEHRREALLLLRSISGNVDLARELFAPEVESGGLTNADLEQLASAWVREGYDAGVPVRRMPNADGATALAVEISENTQREDFSNDEILEVYSKLQKAGYKSTVGRPKPGEKAIMPAMALIFGKHARTVQRALKKAAAPERNEPPRTLVALKGLERSLARYGPELPRDAELKACLRALAEAVEAALARRR
jgi:ParB family chromosome partitioning protein